MGRNDNEEKVPVYHCDEGGHMRTTSFSIGDKFDFLTSQDKQNGIPGLMQQTLDTLKDTLDIKAFDVNGLTNIQETIDIIESDINILNKNLNDLKDLINENVSKVNTEIKTKFDDWQSFHTYVTYEEK